MISLLGKKKHSPIGIDLGTRSVKLIQFNGDHSQLIEAARWDLSASDDDSEEEGDRSAQLAEAIRHARDGREFRGREAIVCLRDPELFVQNIRVPQSDGAELHKLVHQEAAGRISYDILDAEIRYLEAGNVRQGQEIMRELILFSVHRPILEKMLEIVERSGLYPIAVDTEPTAMVRSYVKQFRRDEDRQSRLMTVHVGYAKTIVVISQDDNLCFIKYVDIGGKQFDEAVAKHLKMSLTDAIALRRHNGDRRSEQQDQEVAQSVADATRPVNERLINELSMCVRYHKVTFRGKPLARLVLAGGEASPDLMEVLAKRVGLPCELGDPLRSYQSLVKTGRPTQWDVAAGLALRETENA